MRFFNIILPFFFALITVLHSINLTFIRVHFEVNRDFIAKNLCVNRFNPDSDCKGQCVLMKKLHEETEKEANDIALSNPFLNFGFFFNESETINSVKPFANLELFKHINLNEDILTDPEISMDVPPPRS